MKVYLRRLIGSVLFLLVVAGGSPSALAISFSHVITFNGITGVELDDNNSSTISPFDSWTHDITGSIGANTIADITISSANLRIIYSDINGAAASELWSLSGTGFAENLTNNFLLVNFSLGASALSDLQADGLFTVSIAETTLGRDKFRIFNSELFGNYSVNQSNPGGGNTNNPPAPNQGSGTPTVPEPMTAGLMGLGLGISALLRRFAK